MRKIAFLTATRAEYGKMKSIMQCIENMQGFSLCIFVTGMHMLPQFGDTYDEIRKDGYRNITLDHEYVYSPNMALSLAHVVTAFSRFVSDHKPDMIVVHGDRLDALAGAIVGSFNNILVAHIEGGELSGTIDESIRHAVSKLSHIHLVANEEAKNRLMQLGEQSKQVFVIGSPDIDIMLSDTLPDLSQVRKRYDITADRYAVLVYHPVFTELDDLAGNIALVLQALKQSGDRYIVIMPNNDPGNEVILAAYAQLADDPHFRFLQSMRFEHFLTLLRHAEYIIGNSSAGIREACVYGVSAIDIGSRQQNRYSVQTLKNIIHTEHDQAQIGQAIASHANYQQSCTYFGDGNSAQRFVGLIKSGAFWDIKKQKTFVDLEF